MSEAMPAARLDGMSDIAPDRPVLVAYDGSEDAKHAIAEAAALFAARPVVILSVWQDLTAIPSFAWAPASIAGLDGLLDEARRGAEKMASEGVEIARRSGLDATADTAEASGPVWDAIVRRADERDVAAIVMGSRGYGGMRSALVGSQSTGVVHHARQPVLVVRPPESEA
jgi:nucleotide-binding universal stress UspA family protein